MTQRTKEIVEQAVITAAASAISIFAVLMILKYHPGHESADITIPKNNFGISCIPGKGDRCK